MTFSATEAAFEGFRVVRRNPLAIVFWALAYLFCFGVTFALFGGSIATLMATVESLESSQPSPQELIALMQSAVGLMVLALPLSLIFSVMLNAAIARSVLRPEEKAFGYMRLGGDELRVLAVSLIIGMVFFVAFVVLFSVVSLLAGVAAQINAGAGVLVGVLFGLGALALIVWLSIRLSLAVPLTVAEKRIAPFASFALTKGQSLPILGMAIIAFIMSLLVSLLATIIALPIPMASSGLEKLATLDGQSTLQILQTAGAGLLVWGVVNAIFSALQLAVLYAPFAAAYQDLKGTPVE